MIPYSRQDISRTDIDAVVEVLRSEFLTQGPTVPRFEDAVTRYCGARYGVASNSATSALHIACLALNLGPGDWLWTSPNTFVASANCALHCDAKIDFVDIDPHTFNMSVVRLKEKLEHAEKQGRLPKIVIPVHFAGQPCDMPAIHELSQQYGFSIIEDASHAIGAHYANASSSDATNKHINSIKVGSCAHSDITVFSFHPVKIITSGEGGMAVTNDIELASRLARFRSHGITSDRELFRQRPDNQIWNYQQIDLGFNFRMTDIHAALGLSQMHRLNEFISRRHEIAERYHVELGSLPITTPHQAPGTGSSYHLYPIRINEAKSGKTQQQLYQVFQAAGVNVNIHYIPVHRQPFYESLGFKVGDFPEAECFHQEAISIPIYPSMLARDQEFVIDLIQGFLQS